MSQANKLLATLVFMSMLAACGTQPRLPAEVQPPEERAVIRWQHLIDREPGQAWEYLSPGYRATMSRAAYAQQIASRPVRWTSVHYVGKTCETDDACNVELVVGVSAPSNVVGVGMIDASTNVRESWIKTDGQWFLVPQ